MEYASPRFLGAELFFDDLERAKDFYQEILGLELTDEDPDHHAQFAAGEAFVCLERRGSESDP